jgi:hypothetical protein
MTARCGRAAWCDRLKTNFPLRPGWEPDCSLDGLTDLWMIASSSIELAARFVRSQ